MTEPVRISVLGAQFAGSQDLLAWFGKKPGARLVSQAVHGMDRVDFATFDDEELGRVEVAGAVQPLLDAPWVYRALMANASGLVWMLCRARHHRLANERDADLLWSTHDAFGRGCPVVIAVNDSWCGRSEFEIATLNELRDLLRPSAEVCETSIRHLARGGCADGADDVWKRLRTALLRSRAL